MDGKPNNENRSEVRSEVRTVTRMPQDPAATIDLLKLAGALWSKIWLLVICGAIGASCAFFYTKIFIKPTYQATAMLYVNNNDVSIGETKLTVSSADLYASNTLVNNFVVIMKTRTTMEAVIQRTGLHYTPQQLAGMVSASAKDETSVLNVTVTGTNPEETEIIANALAEVLPDRITSIIKGCSVRIVDRAVVPTGRIAPNTFKNTMMGGMLGLFLAAALVVVMFLMDDVIHDEDEVKMYYSTIPMLGAIPDTAKRNSKSSYYGYGNKKKAKGA